MVFAVMFVVLMIATKLIEQRMGSAGLLTLSAVVGVTDIDPFILSVLHPTETMVRYVAMAIIVAMMSNTIAKSVYFAMLVPGARKETFIRYGIWATLHLPLLVMR
jgi:uncharacterized membrane protein (DUF4010 family)